MKTLLTRTLFGLLSVSACVVPAIACVPALPQAGAVLTPQEIAAHGTRTFQADRAKVLAAAEGALQVLGYTIAFSDAPAGVLKTAPKPVSARTSGYAFGPERVSRTSVLAHAYSLKVTESGGTTTVEATPRGFVDGVEIRSDEWIFGGRGGQYALWDGLFAEISSNLGGVPAVTPGMAAAPVVLDIRAKHEVLWSAWEGAHKADPCAPALELLTADAECVGAACLAPLALSSGYQKHCTMDTDTRLSLHRMRKRWETEAGNTATACLEQTFLAAQDANLAASLSPTCEGEGKTEIALRAAVRRAPPSPAP